MKSHKSPVARRVLGKVLTLIMAFASFAVSFVHAQYQPISPYLQDPTLSIGYVDSCAQFWMKTLDEQRGGFYTNIDRYGNVITNWGNQ